MPAERLRKYIAKCKKDLARAEENGRSADSSMKDHFKDLVKMWKKKISEYQKQLDKVSPKAAVPFENTRAAEGTRSTHVPFSKTRAHSSVTVFSREQLMASLLPAPAAPAAPAIEQPVFKRNSVVETAAPKIPKTLEMQLRHAKEDMADAMRDKPKGKDIPAHYTESFNKRIQEYKDHIAALEKRIKAKNDRAKAKKAMTASDSDPATRKAYDSDTKLIDKQNKFSDSMADHDKEMDEYDKHHDYNDQGVSHANHKDTTGGQSWFNGLSKEKQDAYKEAHPGSKYSQTAAVETSALTEDEMKRNVCQSRIRKLQTESRTATPARKEEIKNLIQKQKDKLSKLKPQGGSMKSKGDRWLSMQRTRDGKI